MDAQVGFGVTLGCAVGDQEEREELVVRLSLFVQFFCIGLEVLLFWKGAGVVVFFVLFEVFLPDRKWEGFDEYTDTVKCQHIGPLHGLGGIDPV